MFTIKNGQLVKYLGNEKVVYIPDSVTTILDGAFLDSTVEEIYGNNVIKIYSNAFYNCNNLKKMSFPKLNAIKDINVTFLKDDSILHKANEVALSVDAEIAIKRPNIVLRSANKNRFKVYKDAAKLLEGIIRMENTIDLIPSATKDLIYKEGYKIYLVDSQIYSDNDIIDAFAVEEDKTIIVDKEYIEEALLHEFGHALDYIFCCSGSVDFRKIYEQEKVNFRFFLSEILNASKRVSSYLTGSPREYFAESFQSIINFPPEYRSECPLTYEYFDSIFDAVDKGKVKRR